MRQFNKTDVGKLAFAYEQAVENAGKAKDCGTPELWLIVRVARDKLGEAILELVKTNKLLVEKVERLEKRVAPKARRRTGSPAHEYIFSDEDFRGS